MAESQSSNGSSSDKDSLRSIEKHIPEMESNCDNRNTESYLVSLDDEEGCEHGLNVCNIRMEEQESTRLSHPEQKSNVEFRQPKTIRNIMIALKEGKVRESSPMRSNRAKVVAPTQRTNMEAVSKIPRLTALSSGIKSSPETPTVLPSKAVPESAKRAQGSHPIKHQVTIRFLVLFLV